MANLRVDKITSTETFETTGSVQFNQNNDNYLSGTITAIGTQDFTIECWVLLLANRAAHQRFFGNDDGAFDSNTLNMRFTPNTTIQMYYGGDSVTSHTLLENRWYHIAMSYSDNVARCYVDGKEFGAILGNNNLGNTTMFIGGTYTVGGENFNGHVSNARLIVGKGIYPKNFKPPMRELEVTPETVLLACQSKTDKLEERSGNTTLSATGTLHSASELTPGILTPVVKSGGGSAITGSVEFTGSPSKLTADSVDFAMGSNDLTMECWFYNGVDTITHLVQIDTSPTQSPSDITNFSLATRDAAAGDVRFLVRNDSGSNLSDLIAGAGKAKINAWHHLAGTIEGTTTRLFLNGILIASGTISGTRTHTGQRLNIGANQTSRYLKGYLSNVRIVKGTALYTADFTPPTRELKRVPGTVLLCCQDPDDVTTEATGKTITGYGDLQRTDDIELITNGSFAGDFTGWTNGNPSQFTYSTDSVGGDTSGKLKYVASDSNLRTFTQYVTCVTGQKYNLSFFASSNASNAMVIDIDGTNVVTIDNNSNANLARYNHIFTAGSASVRIRVESAAANTAYFDNFSVKLVDGSNKGSNFTPQVGDDRKVTFEGVTKINSNAYFYFPTGDTASRYKNTSAIGNGRIAAAGGYSDDGTIDYITISSTGNAQDFGDLAFSKNRLRGAASSTRGLFMGGASEQIQYVTMATTGNAQDFGDSTSGSCQNTGLCSNDNRAVNFIGTNPSTNGIEFMTISTMGVVQDFGDQVVGVRHVDAFGSPTRGMITGGWTSGSANTDTIQFITFATTGNAIDFGNINATGGVRGHGGFSSPTRGVCGGGIRGPALSNTIDFVTIASTGDAQNFGDLTSARRVEGGGASSHIRGVFCGGYNPSPIAGVDVLDFVTIASTGNAADFGDLQSARAVGAASDAHGGLG